MTQSIFEQLCKPHGHAQPNEGTEEQEQQVYDQTALVHQTLDSVLFNLNQRVLTLANGANLDAAIHFAHDVQCAWPTLALGFVHEATIYSAQGRQFDVINICEQALEVIDPQDTHYAMLEQLRQDAVQRGTIRIDFISKLPFDILSSTLIRMFMDDTEPLDSLTPCPYLHVSRAWRDLISLCFGGLCFRTGPHHELENLQDGSQLSIFARHIKSLYVSRYSKGTWLSDLLRRHDFCMLQELIVEDFRVLSMDDFVSSLNSVSSTLTTFRTIHIVMQPYGSVPPLTGVLLSCPNLVSLQIFQPNDTYLCDLPNMTWPNVTTLSILNAREDFSNDEIKAVCERFPSLKEFSIGSCTDLLSIPLIKQYYPSMRRLHVLAQYPSIELRYSDQGPECEEPGITDLLVLVDEWAPDEPIPGIGILLKEYHQTLESITFGIPAEMEDPSMYDIKYPRLKTLHLYVSGWWIPRNAPMLQELQIASDTFTANPAVFDTIPPNLKELRLHQCDGSQHDNKSPIVQYLHRFIQHPHLQDLVIHSKNMDTMTNILDAICRLRQLQTLFLMYDAWDHSLMESFFRKLVSGCPRLADLGINCIKGPSKASILTLKNLASLKKLTLTMESVDEEHGYWETVFSLTHLESITIDPSKGINTDGIHRLKHLRPELKITGT